MKKKLFLLIIFISVFAFQKNTVAQTIRLDSIIGFPDTVTDFQAVNMDLLISNSGGILFSGDLIVFFHSLGDTSGPDTLYYNQNYTLSGNTFYDTVHISHTFTAAELDGGDNIVVVWPASSQMPLQVSGDSITDTIYFNNVGISENKSLQAIRLFPNPSNEKIGFLMANPEKVEQVRIFNALGAELLRLEPVVPSLDISGFPAGIYFARISCLDGSSVVRTFLKE